MVAKKVEDIYVKKDLHQHVLDRPDTYIGSIKPTTEEQYVYDCDNNSICKKSIEYVPGLIKIFDEIIVNAIDHTVRDPTTTMIKVDIDKESGYITVYNNGKGIPVVEHSEYKIYIPELIFGNLLTSSNYNDDDKRVVGGVNGLGAKACNIYSQNFRIETIDNETQKLYIQEFENNMFKINKPLIKKTTKKSYTKISFKPDFKRFKLKGLTDDIISLMKKRVYDTTVCTNKNVSVYLNGEKLKQKDFQGYTSLFSTSKDKIIYDKFEQGNFIWEFGIKKNDSFEQISFVNGIATTNGGKHVEHVTNQIIKKLSEMIKLKKKKDDIKPSFIKDKIMIFLRATIENPNFTSQSKDCLTTPVKDFGIKIDVDDSVIKKLYASEITEEILDDINRKEEKILSKTSGAKSVARIKIPKLEDAHDAGTKNSSLCSLILTEGDSAKAFAISGLSVVGRKHYGVFPLRGKLLNIREATKKQLLENQEINSIKQILGLKHNEKYTSISNLRYGSIILLVDQDVDAIHIKALLVNMFHVWWPELLGIKGFIRCLKTPIVKAKNNKEIIEFYTIQDYKTWEKNLNSNKKWDIKYYKGLGTSSASEAKEIFKHIPGNITNYINDTNKKTNDSMILAFDKSKADDRKKWLLGYSFDMSLDQSIQDVTYHDLINKDLIHFSMYDVIRSIPNICDGFKPSQRKVIYTLFTKKYKKEIKVAQLGAAVAEATSYHHGEASLYGTIVNMAQDYVGSNNINLLKPNGQFGTRQKNGKDSASPRYIFTELNEVTYKLFNNDDLNILTYQEDDGQKIEPLYYIPILPIILINGAQGIGTGFSTSIPCFNHEDIIKNIGLHIRGKKMFKMTPYYNKFKGEITEEDGGNYTVYGSIKNVNITKIKITELPIGVSTEDYKEFLEGIIDESKFGIINYSNNSTEADIDIDIIFKDHHSLQELKKTDIYKSLKLVKNISMKNLHLLDENGKIKKYNTAEEILSEFIDIRLRYNTIRKTYLLESYSKEEIILFNKVKFLEDIMSGNINIYKKTKTELNTILENNNYSKVDNSYSYLTSMPIYSFTDEKIKELKNQLGCVEFKIKELKSKNEIQLYEEDILTFTK